MMKPRVGVHPYVHQGIVGYRVRWIDGGGKPRSYFVTTREAAKAVKTRVKDGRRLGSRWMVRC